MQFAGRHGDTAGFWMAQRQPHSSRTYSSASHIPSGLISLAFSAAVSVGSCIGVNEPALVAPARLTYDERSMQWVQTTHVGTPRYVEAITGQ